jgi:hypothetical protein
LLSYLSALLSERGSQIASLAMDSGLH